MNKQQSSCSSKTKDFWAQNKNKCLSGYTYVSVSNPTDQLGNQACLLYTEFTTTAINTRYASQPSGCTISGDYNTVLSATQAYFASINKYVTQNSQLLSTYNSELDK